MKSGRTVLEGENVVALFDILGFRTLVQSTPPHAFRALLDDVDNFSKGSLVHPTFVGSMLLSDTIILYGRKRNLLGNACMVVISASNLLMRAARSGFPIRGAISSGTVLIDEKRSCIVGSPVVRAYELEQAQNWMGAVVDPEHATMVEDAMKASPMPECTVRYQAPMKSGPRDLHLCIGWTFRLKGMRNVLEVAFRGAPEHHDVYAKLQNTLAFFDYCETFRPPRWM